MNHLLRQLSEDFILFFERVVIPLPTLPSMVGKKWNEFKALLEKPENLLSIHTYVINLYTDGTAIDYLPRKVSLESSFKKNPLDYFSPSHLTKKSSNKKEEFGLISIGNEPKFTKTKIVNEQKYVMLDDGGRKEEGGIKEEEGERNEVGAVRKEEGRGKKEEGEARKEEGGGRKEERREKNEKGGGRNVDGPRGEEIIFKFDFRKEVLKKEERRREEERGRGEEEGRKEEEGGGMQEEGGVQEKEGRMNEAEVLIKNAEKEELMIKFITASPDGNEKLEKLKSESPKKVTFTPTEESPPYLTPIQTKFNPFKIKVSCLCYFSIS